MLSTDLECRKEATPEVSDNIIATPHAAEGPEVARALCVDPAHGLAGDEIESRRARYGANTLRALRSRAACRILLDQFLSPIVALLGAAVVVAAATGDLAEALAIMVVLVLNTLVGFFTEWQAGRALEALRQQSRVTARARRDGYETLIDAEAIVPGDVVILNAGDCVPADARLIEAANLHSDESSLTGESTAVEKTSEPVALDALLADRRCMLYLGTTVLAGHAVAVVTATGAQTELGRIGQLVADAPQERPPLERRLSELGRRLVYLVLAIAGIVMLAGWLRGDGLWLMVEVGISLAVAAVPEALPAVTTLILALGVLRMAREQAIVRRLPAVETLGSTTVICSDKTGTLTENRMTVREYFLADGRTVPVDRDRPPGAGDELLERAVRVGVLCNEASFRAQADPDSRAIGDPTETALLVVADALVLDVSGTRASFPKLDERPFHAASKRMITLHQAGEGARLLAMKGAPAVVLEACGNYFAGDGSTRPIDDETRLSLLAANEAMADRSLRVLALAEKRSGAASDCLADSDLEGGYTFLGFVGMIDPPRAGVAEAVRQAHAAGIRTVMLTGDQINTARAIARELELSGSDQPFALHARDLAVGDPRRLAEQANSVDVFARVSPEDKLRIVEALEATGEIVAVTGDGVNDAPALKRADIGIAMGKRGTEVAKEAADVVLADDNFATIIKAIEGGRTIYANIIKFVHLMFSKNLGEVVAIFVAIVIGWPLPLLPLQILWMNLVTDIFPAFALALEPPPPDVMSQPPRSPRAALLSRPFLLLIAWQGVMLAAIVLAAYAWALGQYGTGAHARTVALFALVGVQTGHLFNCRSRTRSAFDGLFNNPYAWAAVGIVAGLQLLAVYLEPLARILGLVKPTGMDWLVCGAAVIAPVILVELTKLFARHARIGDRGARKGGVRPCPDLYR
jgi:Ca2+-transporting ATPase